MRTSREEIIWNKTISKLWALFIDSLQTQRQNMGQQRALVLDGSQWLEFTRHVCVLVRQKINSMTNSDTHSRHKSFYRWDMDQVWRSQAKKSIASLLSFSLSLSRPCQFDPFLNQLVNGFGWFAYVNIWETLSPYARNGFRKEIFSSTSHFISPIILGLSTKATLCLIE